MMFGSAQPVLLTFPFERPMFLRERVTGTYATATYFLAKLLVELPVAYMNSLVAFLCVWWLVGFQGSFFGIVTTCWGLGYVRQGQPRQDRDQISAGDVTPTPRAALAGEELLLSGCLLTG